MDSGNSGSISSSGDEEYECRTDTDQHQHHHHQIQSMMVPSFLNPSLTAAATTQFTSPGLSAHHHHSNIFDHQSSSSNLLQSNTSSFFLNLDNTVRSRPPIVTRSDHHQQQQQHISNPNPNPNQQFQSQLVQPHSQLSNHEAIISTSGAAAVPAGAAIGGVGGQGSGARASKKRTRASRRAPTTVLTTDTSNFRQMVQEFTGIPAPPFSASSPFSRRFDLFGTASSGSRSSGLELGSTLYPNLVRPSALKPPPPPHHHHHLQHNQTSPFGGSHMAGPSSSSPLFGNAVTSSDQHHHQLGLNVLSMQNQGLSNSIALFQGQSLQVNHLAPSGFGGGDNQTQTQPNLAIDHQHESIMNAAPNNQVSSSEGAVLNIVWRADPGHDMINYSTSASATANTTSSSGFHHGEKQGGLEINNNVASRGEGNVDSWIFPSD